MFRNYILFLKKKFIMKKLHLITLVVLLLSFNSFAQESKSIYATMSLSDALELKKDLPDEVEILEKRRNEAAVYFTDHAGHYLHDKVLVHGPGYIFKNSEEDAIAALYKEAKEIPANKMAFTITEDVMVNAALDLINTQNIEDHILELEGYGTRYHSYPIAIDVANDLKDKWEAMAVQYGRTDVSVRLFNHVNTNMPSVIMTIEGVDNPEEFVIVGGHLDSTASNNNNAPGADDDASGIATMTESVRALFELGFEPQRTIEIMAYAAEGIGLVGSAEIAEEYADNNVNVISVVQFDMTNYNGSAIDVSFITDYTNGTLNSFLMELINYYNADGAHEITYGTSLCNYGCSDHASWTSEGYMASFPFEANFGQHNGNIHTSGDTYSVSGTADHAAKFSKLCTEYLIESAKSSLLSVDDTLINSVSVITQNGQLIYNLEAAAIDFTSIILYDIQGKKVLETSITSKTGNISTQSFTKGIYIAAFLVDNNTTISKKVIIK